MWTGPYPATDAYSLKYCGTDKPMKKEKPRINFVLKLLRLHNWRYPSPAEATHTKITSHMNISLQRTYIKDPWISKRHVSTNKRPGITRSFNRVFKKRKRKGKKGNSIYQGKIIVQQGNRVALLLFSRNYGNNKLLPWYNAPGHITVSTKKKCIKHTGTYKHIWHTWR